MSESGLIDFKDRGNFDFLEFRYAQDYEQKELKKDCERIMQYAHDTVKDLCLLGLRLKELKESGLWREVYDEAHAPFSYTGFEEFCRYTFGFSATRVSDLTRIGAFVRLNERNVDFIDKRYEGFSLSQLVEISSVDEDRRGYFNAEMTIADMRSVKVYMRDSYEFIERRGEKYDIVTAAKNFQERENAKRLAQREQRRQAMQANELREIVIESEQLPGQTSLFDEIVKKRYETPYIEVEEEIASRKEKSDVGSAEECRDEEKKEFETKYPLSVRAGRRAFLEDLSEWRECPERGLRRGTITSFRTERVYCSKRSWVLRARLRKKRVPGRSSVYTYDYRRLASGCQRRKRGLRIGWRRSSAANQGKSGV